MSATTITVIIAVVSSPLWLPVFEFIRNKLWAKINFHGWQAVFINSPMSIDTYFGKITSISKTDVTLTDIYFLTSGEASPEAVSASKDPQLTKLGEAQIHSPEDKMIINRQHIAFLENISEDSNVVKAILEHKKTN
jgi:hypothetical protein